MSKSKSVQVDRSAGGWGAGWRPQRHAAIVWRHTTTDDPMQCLLVASAAIPRFSVGNIAGIPHSKCSPQCTLQPLRAIRAGGLGNMPNCRTYFVACRQRRPLVVTASKGASANNKSNDSSDAGKTRSGNGSSNKVGLHTRALRLVASIRAIPIDHRRSPRRKAHHASRPTTRCQYANRFSSSAPSRCDIV